MLYGCIGGPTEDLSPFIPNDLCFDEARRAKTAMPGNDLR